MSSAEDEGLLSKDEFQQMAAASAAVKTKRGKPLPAREGPQKLERRHRAQSIIQSKALDELEAEVETGLYENVDLAHGSRIPVMTAQVAMSFLWWSVFDALLPMIWFFPLCALEVSGFEIIIILWFSSLFTLLPPVRRALATPSALFILRLLMLVGVASYQSPTKLTRLIVLGVGNMFAVLVLISMWWERSKLDRERTISCHILGFFLMLAIRIWFTSFNPIFTSFLTNNIATGTGVLLSLYLFIQDHRTPTIRAQDFHSSKIHHEEAEAWPGALVTGAGFGALMFMTLWLFGDVSVISRWTPEGYPHPGPYPNPWSALTMVALVLGLILMSHKRHRLTHLSWHAIGLASGLGLYYLDSYISFLEGNILALYTISLWPHLSRRVTAYHPGIVLTIAILSMLIHLLASVWVVAYNFVPGGTVTRERTEVLMAVTVFLMAAASLDYPSASRQKVEEVGESVKKEGGESEERKKGSSLRRRPVSSLPPICEEEEDEDGEGEESLLEFEVSSTDTVHEERAMEVLRAEEKERHNFVHRTNKAAVLILLFGLLGFVYRLHPITPNVQTEHPKMFSAGIWAFHFGFDNEAYPSMERAAQLINNTGVDVIGLLETDATRPYTGNHDIASWLSERLDMYVDYGPGTKDHTWGALVLSKYPIVRSEHHLLPSPDGELAPGLLVTVNISGQLVDFFSVHFGNEVDVLDRKLQAEFTGEVLSRAPHPIVMLSYLTNKPHGRDYNRIVESSRVKDIDPSDKHRWCEYIFYRGVIKLGYARISHGGLSDTEVQVGKFRLPDYRDEPDNDVITFDAAEVPEWTHFPAHFGERYRNHYADESRHHYHMDTPKYFKAP